MLCFRNVPADKIFMDKRGWVFQEFLSKLFCLTVPKILVGLSFNVSLFSGIEKVFGPEGGIKTFRGKFFVSQCRNIS